MLPCPFARPATSWARRPEAGQEPRGLQRGEGAGGGEGFLFALFFCLFFPRARWVTAEPWGQSPPRDPRRHPPPPPASFAPPCYTPPLAPLAGVGASVDAHALGCLLLLGARRCGGGLSGCGFFVVFFGGGCCRLRGRCWFVGVEGVEWGVGSVGPCRCRPLAAVVFGAARSSPASGHWPRGL